MTGYARATFAALSVPNYRLYIAGQGTSVIGTWMQKVAQAWLLLELTDSGAALGLTAALQQLPTLLLTTWGGLLADRVDKRRILLCTQSAAGLPAVVLGVTTLSGHVTMAVVLVCALALGVIESLDRPARLTFVSEIVPADHLTNAVTFTNVLQNAGKVVGPAVAGVMIAAFGTGPTFLINAASFIAMIVSITLIRPTEQPATRQPHERHAVWRGFVYVRRRPDLLGPLVLMTISGTLAYNWTVMLPLLAKDTFGQDARAAGLMFTCMGVGAVVGGLAFAGALQPTTTRLALCGLTFSVALAGAALSPTILVAYALLIMLGGTSVLFRSVANSLVQLRAESHMRGRVIALLILATGGTTTVGGPLVGWLSEVFGTREALLVGAVGTAVAAVGTHLYMGERRLAERASTRSAAAQSDTQADGGN